MKQLFHASSHSHVSSSNGRSKRVEWVCYGRRGLEVNVNLNKVWKLAALKTQIRSYLIYQINYCRNDSRNSATCSTRRHAKARCKAACDHAPIHRNLQSSSSARTGWKLSEKTSGWSKWTRLNAVNGMLQMIAFHTLVSLNTHRNYYCFPHSTLQCPKLCL